MVEWDFVGVIVGVIGAFATFLVLVVGVAHFYLSHISKPKSDIVFEKGVGSYSRAKKHLAEISYSLYLSAINRGDGHGYITDVSIRKVDMKKRNDDEVTSVHSDGLLDKVYGHPPLIVLNEEVGDDEYEKGPIHVPRSTTKEILIVPRISIASEFSQLVKKYESAKFHLTVDVKDTERAYSVDTESEWVTLIHFPEKE